MTGSLWLLLLCCIILGLAPLWYLYRCYELGGRRIAQIGFWVALALLGAAAAGLSLHYGMPGFMLIFIAVFYPILRIFINDALKDKKNARPLTEATHASLLRSPWLELTLTHETGACVGNIRQGSMANWHLHEMDGHDLRNVRHEMLAQDALGVALLDIWLDREGPVHWRRDFSNAMLATPSPTIAVTDAHTARAILGVQADADAATIQAARQRLEALIGKGSEHSTVLEMIAASAHMLTKSSV